MISYDNKYTACLHDRRTGSLLVINFHKIQKYQENNRIEAKRATGGFPHSIWETYSAFANTIGGIILLGVEELADKSLNPVGLLNPLDMVEAFWKIISKTENVSVNILSGQNVQIVDISGKKIVVIEVPRANRHDKPVYLNGDPFSGSYRRNGEGDYHCTQDEVKTMLRDRSDVSSDEETIYEMTPEVLCKKSVSDYRARIKRQNPGYMGNGTADHDFLQSIGALVKDGDTGALHPTAAGLLIFGYQSEILKKFPGYHLCYREKTENLIWNDVVLSDSGGWSGNLYDFYFMVCSSIADHIRGFYKTSNQKADEKLRSALCEAVANAVIHADYNDKRSLLIVMEKDKIVIINPGGLRIDPDDTVRGGISDPRNAGIIRIFSLIGVGKKEGSGLSHIQNVWKERGWERPVLSEQYNPDRTVLGSQNEKGGYSLESSYSGQYFGF